MYERFTDRARHVMQLANQRAKRLKHECVGTEHILLGLVEEKSSVATIVLKHLDVDLLKVRLEIEKILMSGSRRTTVRMLPQTPRAETVIELSIEEAHHLNHNHVGTEHVLLGLIREDEGIAAQVLKKQGLKLDEVRNGIVNLFAAGNEALAAGGSFAASPASEIAIDEQSVDP